MFYVLGVKASTYEFRLRINAIHPITISKFTSDVQEFFMRREGIIQTILNLFPERRKTTPTEMKD